MPPASGEVREQWRGSFCLTEPLPFVGVDTGVLSGKVRVVEWEEGKEPVLQVEKRGRFITNMDFARFVTAAVDSDDPRIKGSCMVILEESDPGTYDRGAPTRKLVHQLSSTRDPIFNLRVPAEPHHRRLHGSRTGCSIPNYSHSEVIESVFRRTRVTVGLMSAAKLLSAVEPVVRYQRGRFRGGAGDTPGSPRFDLGLQMKEDVLHRLVDVWAAGEAGASLGFATARFFDEFDPLDRNRESIFAEAGIPTGRARIRALVGLQAPALEYLRLTAEPPETRDRARFEELAGDRAVQFLVRDAVAGVLCPAVKLWNTGRAAAMMREAVSLMGGYGITEDCPGFLAQKWMDSQLEATYEGPEAVQRRQLSVTMVNAVFLAQFDRWMRELRAVGALRPATGACTLASGMELWRWTLNHLLQAVDAEGKPLYRDQRQGVTFPMADALCWLLASRQQILDVLELEEKGPGNPIVAEGLGGTLAFLTDLCHVQAARSVSETARICSELVFGYNRHPRWDRDACDCYQAGELDALEATMPGIAACARDFTDVIEADGSHEVKAGPCVQFHGLEPFVRMRGKLDGCLTGAQLAKDRAARSLTGVAIPEALDYPA